jgi:hypothetical protein
MVEWRKRGIGGEEECWSEGRVEEWRSGGVEELRRGGEEECKSLGVGAGAFGGHGPPCYRKQFVVALS